MTSETIHHSTSTDLPNAAAAGTWQLGDRTINRLGLGAMRLGGMPWDEQPKSRRDGIAVLRRAIELGVNHIDTAAFYFTPLRSANELISTALQPYPDDLVIVTKVGPSRSRYGEFEPPGARNSYAARSRRISGNSGARNSTSSTSAGGPATTSSPVRSPSTWAP